MSLPLRIAALLLLLGTAACGKMGALEKPPGATYPRGYPAGAEAKPVAGLNDSGTEQPLSSAASSGPVGETHPAFTKSGAWIDPNMHQPNIDPYADQDKWHLNNSIGGY
jgi:hypothetical protein